MMTKYICVCLLVLVSSLSVNAAETWHEDEFEAIWSGIECPAKVAMRLQDNTLTLALLIDRPPGAKSAPAVSVGLAAAGNVLLTTVDAQVSSLDGRDLFNFTIPASKLATSEAQWSTLRMGVAVTFAGGPGNEPLYQIRYRHQDGRAAHAAFSTRPQDWRPFDLTGYRQRVSDRGSRMMINFNQPLHGKASIVIEDAQGRRVRNLVSGLPFAKGAQQVQWDLLDDHGNTVLPGQYNWRSIHLAGIVPEYQFSFCNDGSPPWRTGSGQDMWGPDHSCILTVSAVGQQIFFLSPCAEAGYQGAATDLQGIKRETFGSPTPVGFPLLASDGTTLYTAMDDGRKILLLRYQPADHTWGWDNGGREIIVNQGNMNGMGKNDASFSQANWNAFDLAGIAAGGGKVAVASRATQSVILFDGQTGKRLRTIPLVQPGRMVFAPDGALLAVSGESILRLPVDAQKFTAFIPAGRFKPGAMTCAADGKLYVVDELTSQIVLLDAAGRETGRLGKPGGAYAGPYDAQRMVRPMDLTLADNGWLWVTENRYNPKRVVAWDLATGKVVKEKFGSTVYGASGGGIDPADASRMIGQGVIWKIDMANKTAVPQSILFTDADSQPLAMHWRFLRRDNRTFLIGYSSCVNIVELMADGSGKLLAQYGSAEGFSLNMGDKLPQVFLDAFYQARGFETPEKRRNMSRFLKDGRLPSNREFFIWSDRSGDGQMQADELEFSDRSGCGYWGSDTESLDIVFPLFTDLGNRPGNWRLSLPLLGWYPSGAPRWKPLSQGLAEALPTLPAHWGNESAMADRHGQLILNSEGGLHAYGPHGNLRWSYPNKWAGVHGSHEAPLPSPGQLQGALFFLGNAPLDDGKTDVFILNGNHGRFFALTSDGFYLDEFFKDVRMGAVVDAYMIGGECFGGSFTRSEADKQYYLLSGHTDYRIFRMRGFDTITRGQGGSINVSVAQLDAAQRRIQTASANTAPLRSGVVTRVTAPPALDGSGNGWPDKPLALWNKNEKFPVQVQAGWDDNNLYLRWSVEDQSPWSNHGEDDNLLFKTGDSVDIQLGCDPSALPSRIAPVPGDLRLLIAPFHGKPIAMLYRHRVPGAKNSTPFSSPWRSENVDEVRRLETARVNVTVGRNHANRGGYIVEAAIPLAELGLKPQAGTQYRADVGAIFGDPDGQVNQLRSYWSNQATGLVNDVPGEIMLHPQAWGTLVFEGKK